MTNTTDLESTIVLIGERYPNHDGTRKVQFSGRLLASHSGLQNPPNEDETYESHLYLADDETLIVAIRHYSKPLGEWEHFSIERVTVDELQNEYHQLAEQSGHGRNLTLDEGLELSQPY